MNPVEQLIIELWAATQKESVGAAEIALIQRRLPHESPASIARTLADYGARLEHPQILEADAHWRAGDVGMLFSPEELNFTSLVAAMTWVEKVEAVRARDQFAGDHLRRYVLEIKSELELMAGSSRVRPEEREIAGEVAQWLVVWLQNPSIFADWLSLRRSSPEFLDRFGPQKGA